MENINALISERKIKVKKTVLVILVCILFSALLVACSNYKYDDAWIIGKNSAQIEEKYGSFDRRAVAYDADGLLRNCRAGYVIEPSRKTWHGKTTEQLFCVYFDADGIAVSTEVCSGNWGG